MICVEGKGISPAMNKHVQKERPDKTWMVQDDLYEDVDGR